MQKKTRPTPKIGESFGQLKIIKINKKFISKNRYQTKIICLCKCGNKIETKYGVLLSGDKRSCGCLFKSLQPKKLKVGEKIGNFTYLGPTNKRTSDRTKISKYKCKCGKIKEISDSIIRQNKQISCGCSRIIKCKIGEKFNNLKLIKILDKKLSHKFAIFLCICGKYTEKKLSSVVNGTSKHCGCLTHKRDPSLPKLRLYTETVRFSQKVYKRDNYTCIKCKKRGGYLNAHHLDGYHWCIKKRDDINNGVTLCRNCHNNFHRIYNNKNNTRQQFEEFMRIY